MAVSKKAAKSKLPKAASDSKGAKLDVVIDGPMLFVPTVVDGNVTGVEVYSPINGHPVGALFLPGVWLSDEELSDPKCDRWPEPEDFVLLDPHSYSLHLTQKKAGKAFTVRSIPDTNHKVGPVRRLSAHWEVSIALNGSLSGWSSPRLIDVAEGLFYGSDSPTSPTVALTQKLSYSGVTAAEFSGAPRAAKEYLRENISKGGTLFIIGEVYYQPSMRHERKAIEALATLAGLDLCLNSRNITPSPSRITGHLMPCACSIIVTD